MGKGDKRKKVKILKVGSSHQPKRKDPGSAPRVDWRHILILVVVCAAVYSNTLFMDFVWDDLYQILENPRIRSLTHIPSLFTSEVWTGVKGDYQTPYYRPLYVLSLAVDYFFWADKPLGYHLTNILIHSLVVIVVYLLTVQILRTPLPALIAALIFAVHPVHAEAVAWVSGRAEPLAALFMFAALYFYVLFREKGKRKYIVLSFLCFFLSLLSKEVAITLPLLVLLYEVCFKDGTIKERVLWPVLYGFASLPYLILRSLFLDITRWGSEPLSSRVYTGAGLLVEYVRLLILPVRLKVHYDVAIKTAFLSPDVIIPLILLAGIFLLILVAWKHDKRAFFCVLWVFITLAPVSGIYTLIRPSLMAERYLYVPSAGFSMGIAVIFLMLIEWLDKGAVVAEQQGVSSYSNDYRRAALVLSIIILVVAPLFVLNYQRNRTWADHYHFVSQRVKDAPDYAEAYTDLGLVYFHQKRFDEAVLAYQKALALNPDLAEARDSLGLTYLNKGQIAEAVKEFQEALKLKPRFGGAHTNLGVALSRQGKFDDAEREFRIALRINANDAEARNNLAALYTTQGKHDTAAEEFRKALNATRDNAYDVHYNLGIVHMNKGMLDEAIKEFREALRLKPDYVEAHNNLAAVYMRLGRIDEAAQEFSTALRYRSDDPVIMHNLGVVYLEQGKIQEAITLFKDALSRSPDNSLFKKSLDRAYRLQKDSRAAPGK